MSAIESNTVSKIIESIITQYEFDICTRRVGADIDTLDVMAVITTWTDGEFCSIARKINNGASTQVEIADCILRDNIISIWSPHAHVDDSRRRYDLANPESCKKISEHIAWINQHTHVGITVTFSTASQSKLRLIWRWSLAFGIAIGLILACGVGILYLLTRLVDYYG